jgi:hypothetical protein
MRSGDWLCVTTAGDFIVQSGRTKIPLLLLEENWPDD